MSQYKDWSAICPRCDKHITHADFKCPNCMKSNIKAYSYTPERDSRRVEFGCNHCYEKYPRRITCPSCGATINSKFIETSGCFIATAMFGYDSIITIYLQEFRDNILIKTRFGRRFVFWYYRNSKLILKKLNLLPE